MTVEQVSLALWKSKGRIYQLTKCAIARRATAEKIRAWIAAAPPPPPPPPEPAVTVIAAGRKSRPYCRQPNDCPAPPRGPCRICHARSKSDAPPEPERRAPLGDRRFRENRDPTQRPDTPDMDAVERQRVNGARQFAARKRGQESRAAQLVDSGVDPKSQNSMVQGQMREVERRRADEARQADPVERAKVALQRKGRTVYAATVVGGPKNLFIVSGMGNRVTPAALIAEAERVTGETFRRAAS